jgi:hypothetical protein
MSEGLDIKMARIEEGFKNIDKKFDDHIVDQKEQFEVLRLDQKRQFDSLSKVVDTFICESEKKFAPRWVATIMIWAGTVVGGVVLVGLVSLIYRVIIDLEK